MKENSNPDIGLYMQREEDIIHAPYEKELTFYEKVKRGQVEEVESWMRSHPIGSGEGFGVLSENPVNNLRYHVIVSIDDYAILYRRRNGSGDSVWAFGYVYPEGGCYESRRGTATDAFENVS